MKYTHKHIISVAPMLDCTDRHCRYLLRLISRHTLLYTEMITANAIIHGDKQKLLSYDPSEHPVAFQIGGSEPDKLAECAKIIADYGYDEINLNVGCPSDRVQKGKFGACLMKEPDLVAECIAAMCKAVDLLVTVKTRIGVDECDEYSFLHNFISKVASAGCELFIIHARKAWLKGLSPKENREIPPLRYDVAQQLKNDFPNLKIVINGGVKTLQKTKELLNTFDGVMIGREIYQNPYILSTVDREFYNDAGNTLSRNEVMERFIVYAEEQLANGAKLPHLAKHLFGLYHGLSGARAWRRYLSENIYKQEAGINVILQAMKLVVEENVGWVERSSETQPTEY